MERYRNILEVEKADMDSLYWFDRVADFSEADILEDEVLLNE